MRWRRPAHKQRAQIALLMPVAVLTCIGILGLVLDVGLFQVIDTEFENAAAAGALAAAWYDPVCPTTDSRCARPDNTAGSASNIAGTVANANLGMASKLCASPLTIQVQEHAIESPDVQAVSVVISCDAPYLAGAVLQVGSGTSQIVRWSTAGLGSVQSDGSYAYVFGQDPLTFPLVTSLIPL